MYAARCCRQLPKDSKHRTDSVKPAPWKHVDCWWSRSGTSFLMNMRAVSLLTFVIVLNCAMDASMLDAKGASWLRRLLKHNNIK
ncbi:membrane-associated protein, putative [Bodo saltans]|uniref:Membrane-associated protein, putative n=1 Tax=Bodo saltans TaxID=75058 RepID=A0A0S4IIJ8_BODSA|nr:membrane-associated protein, putative [Bodo saltans]|eukprot:CUE72125.1 membrane-associated protein, putative [Bodo saltans]